MGCVDDATMRSEYSIHVEKPVAEVFAFVKNSANLPKWMDGVVSTVDLETRDEVIGGRFQQTIREGRKLRTYDGEFVAYEKNKVIGVVFTHGDMVIRPTFFFHPEDTGTRVVEVVEADPGPGFMKALMAPVMRAFNAFFLRRHLRALKRVIEAS